VKRSINILSGFAREGDRSVEKVIRHYPESGDKMFLMGRKMGISGTSKKNFHIYRFLVSLLRVFDHRKSCEGKPKGCYHPTAKSKSNRIRCLWHFLMVFNVCGEYSDPVAAGSCQPVPGRRQVHISYRHPSSYLELLWKGETFLPRCNLSQRTLGDNQARGIHHPGQ
jgi:hypothetical protein